jgi:hypothetical protein
MSKLFERMGNTIVLDRRQPFPGNCQMCGHFNDLRPYGPNNENICFDCAMKDEPTTRRKFYELLNGQA